MANANCVVYIPPNKNLCAEGLPSVKTLATFLPRQVAKGRRRPGRHVELNEPEIRPMRLGPEYSHHRRPEPTRGRLAIEHRAFD